MFEKNNDAKMKRTARRPLPSGRISIPHAAIWATTIGVTGTTLLAYQVSVFKSFLNIPLYENFSLYLKVEYVTNATMEIGKVVAG